MRVVVASALLAVLAGSASAEVGALGAGAPVLTGTVFQNLESSQPGERVFRADGQGGAYLVYTQGLDMRLVRLDTAGRRRLDWPEDGRPVYLMPPSYCCVGRPALVPTDRGIIVALDTPGASGARRYDDAGLLEPGWYTNGTPGRWLFRPNWYSRAVDAVPDGDGGTFLVANLSPLASSYTTLTVAVQHIRSDGAFTYPWSDLFPYEVTSKADVFGKPVMASDGRLGAFVAWDDSTAPGMRRVRLVRIDFASVPAVGWTLPGIVVREAPGDGSGWPVALAADGAGGALVAWDEFVAGFRQIRVQRIASDGVVPPQWPADGVVVTPAGLGVDCLRPQLVGDGAGGAYVSWHVDTQGTFITHIRGDGTIAPGSWGAGGKRPAPPPYTDVFQTASLAPDGQGGLVITWSAHDLLSDNSAVAVQRLLADGSPAPGWPSEGYVTPWVQDGSLIFSKPVAAVSGPRVLVAWFRGPTASSNFELRTAAITLGGTLPATTAPGARIRFSLVQPQPASGTVRGMLALPNGGDVLPAIVDLTGRRVRTLAPMRGLPAGVHDVVWDGRDDNGRDAPSGVYLLTARVEGAASGHVAARVVLAR